MNVYLVDDEPNILRAFARVLKRQGHEVITFETTSAALSSLQAETKVVDVVVSDFSLGAASDSGIVFLTALRAAHPEVFRVLMSGQLHIEGLRGAISDGIVDVFVPKGDITDLTNALDEFEQRRAGQGCAGGTDSTARSPLA